MISLCKVHDTKNFDLREPILRSRASSHQEYNRSKLDSQHTYEKYYQV